MNRYDRYDLLAFLALALFGAFIFFAVRYEDAAAGQTAVCTERLGDIDGDGVTTIADPIYELRWLFSAGPPPVPHCCEETAP